MAYFYKYVDPATLLVTRSSDLSTRLTDSENSKLMNNEDREKEHNTNQLDDYENGKKSPLPHEATVPQPSDYESEF